MMAHSVRFTMEALHAQGDMLVPSSSHVCHHRQEKAVGDFSLKWLFRNLWCAA